MGVRWETVVPDAHLQAPDRGRIPLGPSTTPKERGAVSGGSELGVTCPGTEKRKCAPRAAGPPRRGSGRPPAPCSKPQGAGSERGDCASDAAHLEVNNTNKNKGAEPRGDPHAKRREATGWDARGRRLVRDNLHRAPLSHTPPATAQAATSRPRPAAPREHEPPQTPGLPAASLALASSTGGGSQPLRLLSPWREEPKSPPVGATAGLGTARRARRLTLTVGDSAACSMPTTWGTQGEGQQRHTAGARPGGACGQTDGRGAGAAPPGPCEERAAQVSTLAAGRLRLLPPSVFDSDSGKPGCSRAPPSIAMAAALK